MIPNGAAMLTEFTPRRYRPMALAIGMSFVGGGSMIAGLIGNVIIEPYGASGLFLILGGVAVGAALLLLLFLPESPVYLANHGKNQQMLKTIARRCGLAVDERPIIANAPQALLARKTSLAELFLPDVASSTILVWTGLFFCLLANYAMVSWVPAMLAGLGFPLSYTSLGMTAQAAGGLIGGVTSGWLIRRFGTRGTLPSLAACGAVSAIVLGLLIQQGMRDLTTVFLLLGFIGFFIAGLLNGCYTISAFIYPDHARGTGVGAAAAAGRLGAIASSYAGVIALSVGGASGYFLLIAVAMMIGLLAVATLRKQIPAVR
jgi:MFS transporter, AAHS family, 4-hydroxybenzoate transporter